MCRITSPAGRRVVIASLPIESAIDYLADPTRRLSFHCLVRLRPKSGSTSDSDSGGDAFQSFTPRASAAIHDYQTDRTVVRGMVNRLVLAVTGKSDIASAWSSLVAPNDKIGIKISAVGGELFTTHRDIVNAIVDGLVEAGHSRESIIVWDREIGGIKEAGYRTNSEGYRIKSITPRDGYDAKDTISAPFLGNLIWGDFEYRSAKGIMPVPLLSDTENTSSVSHFARILTSE